MAISEVDTLFLSYSQPEISGPCLLEGRIVVVIPAYNEERFIGSVVLQAREYADAVIVVDDGSCDATAEIARAAGAVVVRHTTNQGKGTALNSGFCKAREFSFVAVVMLDADGQHLPDEIRQVLAPVLAGEADIVVGSRYLENHSRVPWHRVVGHWGFNLLTNLTSGVTATDSQSGFRAFSPQAMEAITFSSSGFSVESEMQFLAHDLGLRFKEVPIIIKYEDKPKRNVFVHGMMVLNGMLRLVGQHRPLLFFGVPGMVLLVAGLLWAIWVLTIYQANRELAIGYSMISVSLSLIGVLSLFTGITLHSIRSLLLELLHSQPHHQ